MAENETPHQRCFGLMTLDVRLKSVAGRLHSWDGIERQGLTLREMSVIAPAFNAGRVRHCVSISKTTAKTTTKTV
jgi:hypothetical protein